MSFKRGQFVRITFSRKTIDGMILLASRNNVSLMLGFAGALTGPGGGMYIGSMPVMLDEHGGYRDLIENAPVTIEPRRE